MTRRYTRGWPRFRYQTVGEMRLYHGAWNGRPRHWVFLALEDGTMAEGRNSRDAQMAKWLPTFEAYDVVTPVPVDLNQEAAKFARAKKR